MDSRLRAIQVPRRFVREEWGGTETVILETCKRLPHYGVETEVMCPNALSDCADDVLEGVRVRRLPYFYPYLGLRPEAVAQLDRKGGNLFSFPMLRALQREPHLDVVHLHTGKRLGGICRYVCRQRHLPYIVSVHGGVIDVPAAEAETWTEPTRGAWEWGKILGAWVGSRRVLDDAAAIICVDPDEALKMARRFPAKRVLHLPNGVDAERFRGGQGDRFRNAYAITPDTPVILNVSRIDHQKNQQLAVTILARVRAAGLPAHLVLIGPVTNSDYLTKVQSLIADLDLEASVTIIPGLPPGSQTLSDAYAAADVFLLTSLHEPFGIVILEAWAATCAVVTSEVGGIPHFTEAESDVLRFASGNAEAGAAQVTRVLANPELRRGLATRGRQKAEGDYSWDRVTKRLAELYGEVRTEGQRP